MKTIVVYYSLEGNTDYAAREIAALTGADLLRIEPSKAYPDSGFRKFFWGGKSALMGETPELQPYTFDSKAYERIILGFPVWAGNVAPPVRSFVRENDLHGKRVAAFACQSGAGAEKAFRKLKALPGIDALEAELILIDPKDRPDAGNGARIRAFCEGLDSTGGIGNGASEA